MTGPLTAAEIEDTAAAIEAVQLRNGMIPWFEGGHADPWNHIEAAMALVLAGRRRQADRAFEWLAATQLPDGTWCRYHLAEGIEDPRRDPNVGAYVATGAWWHYLCTGDLGLLEAMWPVVEAAVGFALRLQQPGGGEVLWSMDPDGQVGRYALLTGTSSIQHSLRCAVAIAECLGSERPEWEASPPTAWWKLDRPPARQLCAPSGAGPWTGITRSWREPVSGESAHERFDGRWSEFVLEGVGVRCVSDHSWVTAAETAECVMALDAVGRRAQAVELLDWTRHLRHHDGSYWTGCVHPECVRFPGGERSTYTAAAVVLADHALYGFGRSAGLFRGEALPGVVDVADIREPLPIREALPER